MSRKGGNSRRAEQRRDFTSSTLRPPATVSPLGRRREMSTLDESMFEPNDTSGGAGTPRGGEANASKQGQGRPRPWSVVRGPTPVPLPLVPEEPLYNEVVPAPPPQPEPIPHELLHLWAMLTQREKWSSLVVVPAQPGASGIDAARAIVEVGNQYREKPIRFISAEGLPPGAGARLAWEMRAHVEQGGMVVVCIDSVLSNPVCIEVAMAAERALLCVPLGSTQFSAARQTLELIGKHRFLGSVTLQPKKGRTK